MGPGVRAQVEAADGLGGQRTGGRGHLVRRPGKGEHGAMVVRVPVQIEEHGPGGGGQGSEHGVVAALADVDDTLEDRAGRGHDVSVARASGHRTRRCERGGAGVERAAWCAGAARRPGSGRYPAR